MTKERKENQYLIKQFFNEKGKSLQELIEEFLREDFQENEIGETNEDKSGNLLSSF